MTFLRLQAAICTTVKRLAKFKMVSNSVLTTAKVFLNNWPIVGLSISQYNVHLHGMQYVTYSCTILLSLRLPFITYCKK